MEFRESAKDRDALIEAGSQLCGPDANNAQQSVHSIYQRCVTLQTAYIIELSSILDVFCDSFPCTSV